MNKKEYSKLIFTKDYPTPIVEDFRTYLTYLSSHRIKLTKVNGYFTKKDLIAIYSKMKCDTREVPQHGTQQRYPILHLFYHLSMTLDFFKVQRTQSSATAIIQNEQIDAFMNMTETEQYVTLLEAFWTETDWEELQGEEWGGAPSNIDFLLEEFDSVPADQELDLSRYKEIGRSVYNYGSFFYYFVYFGLWEIIIDREKPIRPNETIRTVVKSITLTQLFKMIQSALYETWDPDKDAKGNHIFEMFDVLFGLLNEDMDNEVEEEEEIEPLSELLRPLFSKEAFTTILKKKQPTYEEGTYHFKVQISPSCWRTFQLSSAHTLLDLHEIIQDAFDFDDDHLYAFYMDGKRFSKSCYNSPMDSHGPYVNDAEIGRLELYEGQHFLYLFDFGDEWTFDVQVMEIIKEKKISEPQIVEVFGEAPEQYSW